VTVSKVAVVKKEAAPAVLRVNQDWCKGCGICAAFCPRGALSLNEQGQIVVNRQECSLGAVCEMFCPDFAIVIK
jgi:2-oxoglutarate ferredoxin oxidoreductase subunit delta